MCWNPIVISVNKVITKLCAKFGLVYTQEAQAYYRSLYGEFQMIIQYNQKLNE